MKPMDPVNIETVMRSVAEAVIASTDELTALDQAIGDGDHGLNMRRGFQAVLAATESWGGATLAQVCGAAEELSAA